MPCNLVDTHQHTNLKLNEIDFKNGTFQTSEG